MWYLRCDEAKKYSIVFQTFQATFPFHFPFLLVYFIYDENLDVWWENEKIPIHALKIEIQ